MFLKKPFLTLIVFIAVVLNSSNLKYCVTLCALNYAFLSDIYITDKRLKVNEMAMSVLGLGND